MFNPGGTITHEFTIPFAAKDISKVIVSYRQDGRVFLEKAVEFGFSPIEAEKTQFAVLLSQVESLGFADHETYSIQLNVITVYGQRYPSKLIIRESGFQHIREVIDISYEDADDEDKLNYAYGHALQKGAAYAGFNKITSNGAGHIVKAEPVEAKDIQGLGFYSKEEVDGLIRQAEDYADDKADADNVQEALDKKADKTTVNEISSTVKQIQRNMAAEEETIAKALENKANAEWVAEALSAKANTTEVNVALGYKANATEVREALESKANKADIKEVQQTLEKKANSLETETALKLKADKQAVDLALETKADKTATQQALDTKANKQETEDSLAAKANAEEVAEALNQKADTTEMEEALALKTDQTETDKINAIFTNMGLVAYEGMLYIPEQEEPEPPVGPDEPSDEEESGGE